MRNNSFSPLRIKSFFASISQVELARRAGICQVTVSKIERGKHKDTRKSREVQRKIAAALNVSVEELFPRKEN